MSRSTMSSRARALLAAGLTMAVATAIIVTFEFATNPFAEPESTPTLQPMPTAPADAAPTVLPAARTDTEPDASDLAAALDDILAAETLGGRVGFVVADLTSGEVVYERDGDAALTPASTLKVLTSAAVLDVLGPDWRFATQVVTTEDSDEVILIGGGDPTLSTADPLMPESTSLEELADRTADALAAVGTDEVQLNFDDSLFTGPEVNPAWEPGYVPGGNVAPTTALAVDGGRVTPGLRARSDDPSAAATASLAELLDDRGVAVKNEPAQTSAPDDAVPVAAVESAPLGDIVEYVLASSNNDMAETLARHVAVGLGMPGSIEAATEAIATLLGLLDVDTSDVTILDGSGLARGNAVSADVMVEVLVAAADPANPQLRPVLTGLPVAMFSGTLSDRVVAAPGVVRAKTGTLGAAGVHSLAGVVTADDDAAYAFAHLVNESQNALEAQAGLDAVAAALTRSRSD